MIDRASREKLIADDAVLAVEVEDVEALDWAADGERVMPKSA
jgi:phenylpyruvate tautomerase PptA (4-oxalocrotonate tautomerase family)